MAEEAQEVAFENEGALLVGEARDGVDGGDGGGVAHLEGVVAAEQDVVGAGEGDQPGEGGGAVEDGVVVEVAQPLAGGAGELGGADLWFGGEAAVEAAGLPREEAAAVDDADAQVAEAFQDAAEDQVCDGDDALGGVAHQV